MADDDGDPMPSGIVAADETWVGPNPKNWHKSKRHAAEAHTNREHKTPVLSVLERESGRVRSRVVPNVKRDTLKAGIQKLVDLPGHRATHRPGHGLRTHRLEAAAQAFTRRDLPPRFD